MIYLSKLLIRYELQKTQKQKQRFFHDEVSYERSRRDSASIRYRISIRVYMISPKGHKMHYNAYIITKSLKHIIFISGEILFGLNDDEIRPFSVISAGIDTEFAQ